MKKSKRNQDEKPWLLYLLLSIPVALVMEVVIRNHWTILFWTYLGAMGSSALIAKWYTGAENKSRWIITVEHIAMVSGMSLFMWCIIDWLLGLV